MIQNHIKTLVFTILDISQRKKLMIVKILSVNPLYLNIGYVIGYIEEKGGKKYLVFDSINENKELIKKYSF